MFQPTLGLNHENIAGEYTNGRLTCIFSYVKSKSAENGRQDDNDLLADLSSKQYHVIMAKGPTTSEGNLCSVSTPLLLKRLFTAANPCSTAYSSAKYQLHT